MDKIRLKEQVEIIRQAFSYINRFQNETFIIKIDSTLITHELFPVLIKDLVLLHRMGIKIILVPGARSRINEVLSKFNINCPTVNGIRVSSPEAIPFIKMAAFDVSNKLMTMLAENGANAIIGNWVKAKGIGVRDGIDFQNSGMVEKLQTDILRKVLQDDLIPIFPNIGWSAKGKPYNLSSNHLAFSLSVNMNAAKLFYVNKEGGIKAESLKIPDDVYISEDKIISQLTIAQSRKLLDINIDKEYEEHTELISLGYRACRQGVKRVHIINGKIEGMLLQEIFSNRGMGTMIYANQHENIRKMVPTDIPEVLSIMQPEFQENSLVERSASDLEKKIDDYAVYEVDGTIHGCAALHIFPNRQGEIAAVAVDKQYASMGIGKKMISYFLEQATKMNLKSVFVLTTQTADFFALLGFKSADVNSLPAEKQRSYSNERNSLVMVYEIPNQPRRSDFKVD
ncbi:N-acetylglutamate synthase [Chitinispirillum alkaliphilum]|nr:N-acetylglutamate synthase [Chitinispirillum alkaliphilum]